MKTFGVASTSLVVFLGTIALCAEADGFFAALLFAPFSFWPLAVSIELALKWAKLQPVQVVLAAGSGLYALWFALVYLDVFYWHPDAQGPIAFVFMGIFYLPVMLPVWIVAWRVKLRAVRAVSIRGA